MAVFNRGTNGRRFNDLLLSRASFAPAPLVPDPVYLKQGWGLPIAARFCLFGHPQEELSPSHKARGWCAAALEAHMRDSAGAGSPGGLGPPGGSVSLTT